MPTEDQAIAAEEPHDENEEPQTAQYATKDDVKGLSEKVDALVSKLQDETPDKAQDIMAQYNELFPEVAPTPGAEGEEPPPYEVRQRIARLERMIADGNAKQTAVYNQMMRETINAKGRAKYDDWAEHEEELWKFAAQPEFRNIQDFNDVYVLWKFKTQGKDALTPKQQKQAKEAVQDMAKEAKAAGSEKPGAGSEGKARENQALGDFLRDTWNKMPSKPTFT